MCVEDGLHFFPFSYRACETRYLPTYLTYTGCCSLTSSSTRHRSSSSSSISSSKQQKHPASHQTTTHAPYVGEWSGQLGPALTYSQ